MARRSPTTQSLTAPVLTIIGLAFVRPAPAQPVSLLTLGDTRPERVVACVSAQPPPAEVPSTPMLRRLAGVLDVFEGPRLAELTRSNPRNPPPIGRPPDAQTLCFLHLSAGARAKVVEVSRDPTGMLVGEEQGAFDIRPPRAELNQARADKLFAACPAYLGGFDDSASPDPRGRAFELPQPYTSHRLFMDRETMGDRVAAGDRWRHDPCDRDLAKETFHARLPLGYSPRRPAGVLVWVDPTDAGRIPEALHAAADELNLICIGAAGAGNRQPIVRRFQLALDGAATASRRWHTDPARVYITGMSGGGRVASIMLGCFPDVFTGAVPIVGLSVYKPVPKGTGAYWRPEYARSALFPLFKTRRLCSITGDRDFNQPEMIQATRLLERDGVPARLLDVPGLGHEMPAPETFLEALRWVDEPALLAAQVAETQAQSLLDEHAPKDGAPLSPNARAALERVTAINPWGIAAWKAAETLNADRRP